ncbi:MAG: M48 family metallopeptidase [Desulfopila sp.]
MKSKRILLDDLALTIQWKRVKNVNLVVSSPDGRVRVSAPLGYSEEMIRTIVAAKQPWIMKKRAAIQGRTVLSPPSLMANGEPVAVFGRPFPLVITEKRGAATMRLVDDRLELEVRPAMSAALRREVLNRWYRQQLQLRIPALLSRYQTLIGVEVLEWRIRQMKTRWGSCNVRDRRIWLNLVLARLAPVFLEYVLVHELVHLLEKSHNGRFQRLMDRFFPRWRQVRAQLKQISLLL